MHKIIIWDHYGTIVGSQNPHDPPRPKDILPNVEHVMRQAHTLNIICSGIKTTESEKQGFDPVAIINTFKKRMTDLPISIATFSPAVGGTECWVLLKRDADFEIREAHQDERYIHLIGQFKKPDVGMLVVIKDLLKELKIAYSHIVFVGDSWQDEHAARGSDIPFVHAKLIHEGNALL